MVPILPEKNCPDLTSEVRRTVEALSAAWRERRYDALAALFADDMVFALPGFTGRLEGGPAIVASYREFMDRVELTHYQEDAPTIDVWGDTAVVSYRWDMAWVAGGVRDRPRRVRVSAHSAGRCRRCAVARHLANHDVRSAGAIMSHRG